MIARRGASKNYAFGSNCALTRPCLSSGEACTSGRTNESWACSPTTRLLENRARATFGKTGQISTALICGGSVETDLQCSVDGQSANLRLGAASAVMASRQSPLTRPLAFPRCGAPPNVPEFGAGLLPAEVAESAALEQSSSPPAPPGPTTRPGIDASRRQN